MQKPLISAGLEMGGFVLVEAPAPSPGEHKVLWTTQSFGLQVTGFSEVLNRGRPSSGLSAYEENQKDHPMGAGRKSGWMRDSIELRSCRRPGGGKQMSTGHLLLNGFKSLSRLRKERRPPCGWSSFFTEMEGFEPPHAFRRLADFESAPFSRLGTSPDTRTLYHGSGKNQGFSRWFFASSRTAAIFLQIIS